MHLYSNSLIFCFIQGIIYTSLLFWRGYKNDRLSDVFLGLIIFACCLEISDYMLGFMGINILWEQLEFFPRNINLLLGPFCYFYLLSQTNQQFKLKKSYFLHALPFLFFTVYHLVIFANGHNFVLHWESTVNSQIHFILIEKIAYLLSNYIYLFLSLRLYLQYQKWVPSQFSDIDTIAFKWFRNFMLALTVSLTINWIMEVLNSYFELSYYQNWWGKLATGILIYYLSILGFAQKQSKRKAFVLDESSAGAEQPVLKTAEERGELEEWRIKLETVMRVKKLYLKPEFSLVDLACEMNTNTSFLSNIINKATSSNFNDFINEFRVDEFEVRVMQPEYKHFSLTGIAYDCGFNSKATFYRAFKKSRNTSPTALITQLNNKIAPQAILNKEAESSVSEESFTN
jgi:AraC-like DNA-binding protein